MMIGPYIYTGILFLVFIYLAYKVYTRKKKEREAYEEREEDVFYEATKNIRRDR